MAVKTHVNVFCLKQGPLKHWYPIVTLYNVTTQKTSIKQGPLKHWYPIVTLYNVTTQKTST